MVLSSSCRCGAGVKTIRQSCNSSRVRNPAPLGCVSCLIFSYTWYIFLLYKYLYIFFYLGVGALYLLFLFLIFFSFATHHPHVGVYLFVFYMGRRRGIGKWWRRAVGVQRSQVNGLGELLPLFCVVILVFSFSFF